MRRGLHPRWRDDGGNATVEFVLVFPVIIWIFFAAMESGHLASDGRARRTKSLTASGGTVYITMTFAVVQDDAGETIGSVAVAREWVREEG